MKTSRALWPGIVVIIGLAACERPGPFQGYFPETGKAALHQRILDLENDFNVLALSLEPGFEDLPALAYLRMARGATIASVFLTNGEERENDQRRELPSYRAATRRSEAEAASRFLDAEAYFLNLPNLIAFADSAAIARQWPPMRVEQKLAVMIRRLQPDLILLSRDWDAADGHERFAYLERHLKQAIELAAAETDSASANGLGQYLPWQVSRLLVDDGHSGELRFPIESRHPRWQKTFRQIGDEAAELYRSIAQQRRSWLLQAEPRYRRMDFSNLATDGNPLPDAGLPLPTSNKLAHIEKLVSLAVAQARDGDKEDCLQTIVTALDSIMLRLPTRYKLNRRDNRRLLAWKKGLDDLRNVLLDIRVDYTISDTALTQLQVTYLNIAGVSGIGQEGESKITFGGLINTGWAINEDIKDTFPLVYNDPYRLLTPKELDFTAPRVPYGLDDEQSGAYFLFFIVHNNPDRRRSFIHRSRVEIDFVPRFEAEMLTPVVRMTGGERVLVALRNHSRDGVADTASIDHFYAKAAPNFFRLSNKEDRQVLTFFPVWNQSLEPGRYEIPVTIKGEMVAEFTAVKFDAQVDTTKRVGVLTRIAENGIERALDRLHVPSRLVDVQNIKQQIDSLDVLLIDAFAVRAFPQIASQKAAIDAFVKQGGHVVILAQSADTWSAAALWPDIELQSSVRWFADSPVKGASNHVLLTTPNIISPKDWQQWTIRRAYNRITVGDPDAEIVLEGGPENLPLLVSKRHGRGHITYVDLALGWQLIQVHPGAFRVLANLISFAGDVP